MKDFFPMLVTESGIAQPFEKLNRKDYDEKYIQTLCFANPELLCIKEIDIASTNLAPLCMEMQVDNSGHCLDNLYVDKNGILTIAEFKLSRNHQSEREVLGQVLDYAKEFVKYDFNELDRRVKNIAKESIFDITEKWFDDVDNDYLKDCINKNLKEGRLNLVIAGDKITHNVEELVSFLNGYAKMSFKLGIVEIQLFKIPNEDKTIVIPNCLMKTVEYRLFRIGDDTEKETEYKVVNSIDEFYKRLQKSTLLADKIKTFVDELCCQFNLVRKIGRGNKITLNLKTEDEQTNLISVDENGLITFYGIVYKNLPEKTIKAGEKYLNDFCKMADCELIYGLGSFSCYPKKNNERLNIKSILNCLKNYTDIIKNYLTYLDQLTSLD